MVMDINIANPTPLIEASVEKCVSPEEFEAGGYKWALCIYPNGIKRENGEGHVSIYLVLMEPSPLPVDREVNAIVNFSAYNFNKDEYDTTQDTSVRSFHGLKRKSGIPKFIELSKFKDHRNGYLIKDTCIFGAEVFVVKNTNRGDCLSMIPKPVPGSYTWNLKFKKFKKFCSALQEKYESESFAGGDYKWKLLLYPKGTANRKGNSVSLFLELDVSTLPSDTKLVVDCTLRIKNQVNVSQHAQRKFCRMFSNTSSVWGSRQLVALAEFEDPKNGFLVEDSCIVEAEITVLGQITHGID